MWKCEFGFISTQFIPCICPPFICTCPQTFSCVNPITVNPLPPSAGDEVPHLKSSDWQPVSGEWRWRRGFHLYISTKCLACLLTCLKHFFLFNLNPNYDLTWSSFSVRKIQNKQNKNRTNSRNNQPKNCTDTIITHPIYNPIFSGFGFSIIFGSIQSNTYILYDMI